MKKLSSIEVCNVNGGADAAPVNIGNAASAIAAGVILGGPVGLGYALCGIIISIGVNGMIDLINKKWQKKYP